MAGKQRLGWLVRVESEAGLASLSLCHTADEIRFVVENVLESGDVEALVTYDLPTKITIERVEYYG